MENDSFRRALSDFAFDVASGGAIRHLTDLGYTVKQIQETLDFPTPPARIQEAVWKRLVDSGVILLEEPGRPEPRETVRYVREYDSYGKASFRRVVETNPLPEAEGGFLTCEFGILRHTDPEKYRKVLAALEERQAEYIDGLPWPKRRVWHRADERMLEIGRRLRAAGLDLGVCHILS
ncbi:MAG: hypothetical protein NC123_07650 [Butyrivibrio sp.]|nr:hypothetical protein [Acetatifactor muris]MCM1559405.1 hypothetical protein [Butyrivibrio sp.]